MSSETLLLADDLFDGLRVRGAGLRGWTLEGLGREDTNRNENWSHTQNILSTLGFSYGSFPKEGGPNIGTKIL